MQTSSSNGDRMKRSKVFLYGFILFVSVIVIWIGIVQYRSLQKQKEAQVFIGQVINSVLEDTKFYKDNSEEDIIVELQENRNIMTDNYTISTLDYSGATYEAKISFDNGIEFKVDVSFYDNKPFLSHFRRLKK